MADKQINELVAATSIGANDLFVLEQSAVAKKLTGQILENWLVSFADGHGGIQSITKTSSSGTNPVIDVYTVLLADTTAYTFTVTNGVKGDTGQQTYVWIKYASAQPTANNQMSDSPDKWIGVYVGLSSTKPTNYTAYTWYQWKGDKGDTGDAVTNVVRTSGTGQAGSVDVYTMYVGTTPIGSFTVVNGLNGQGAVNSVNGELPDENGNVEITIPPSIYVGPTAPTDPDIVAWFDTDDQGASMVNSVNNKSGVVSIGASLALEYEGDHGQAIFDSSWTATYDGLGFARFQSNSSGSPCYWYIKDSTDDVVVAFLETPSGNQVLSSTSFPIINGHTYITANAQGAYSVGALCYRFKITMT